MNASRLFGSVSRSLEIDTAAIYCGLCNMRSEACMRRSLLLAAGCLICLMQPGLAQSVTIKLSRPNTGYSTFLDDRAFCLNAVSYPRDRSHDSQYNYGFFTVTYDVRGFINCMYAKGYKADPDGFRAVQVQDIPYHGTRVRPL
jgi:hypothetical protein